MKIERAIYASLPLGIDSETNGLQYYSYTAGFKKLIELDVTGAIKGLTAGSYKFPSGSDWLRDLPENVDINGDLSDYPLIIPETVVEANKIENRIKHFSPYSLSYKPIVISDEKCALFLFGKNMGMDWSGGRPGNPYIYSVICGMNDIKHLPIFYCSSPAITCDIRRSEFYPENLPLKKPNTLEYIDSLDASTNIAPLDYSAGFESIMIDDVVEFINSEGHIDVLISMFSALVEYKDGNMKRRLVIADSCENILMWIAALSYIFPVDNAKTLSFSSYTYAPGDFDINGVFVPELNNCPPSTRTGYEYNIIRNAYAVYDFKEDVYAPEVTVQDTLFISVLRNSFEINISLIDNYKKFISKNTTYCEIGSEYANGYDLFSYMSNMIKYNLENVVDFAVKYANVETKIALLKKLLTDSISLADNITNIDHIRKYVDYCVEHAIESKKNIDAKIARDFIATFLDHSSDDRKLHRYIDVAEKIYNINGDNLGLLLMSVCQLRDISDFIQTTKSTWRILYINRAICLYVGNKNINISTDSEIGKIQSDIIVRLVIDDSISTVQQVDEYIKELLTLLSTVTSQVNVCDCILCGLQRNGFVNCENKVLDTVDQMYIEGDFKARGEIMSAINQSSNSNFFTQSIIDSISKMVDVNQMIISMRDFFINGGSIVRQYADKAKKAVINAVNNTDTIDLGKRNDIIYSANEFLLLISKNYGISVQLSEHQRIYDMYLSNLFKIAPNYILAQNYIRQYDEMSNFVQRIGGKVNPELLRVFKSLDLIKKDVTSKKQGSCYSFKKTPPFDLVDLSKLPDAIQQTYMKSLGILCAEHWAATDEMPLFQKMFTAKDSEKHWLEEAIFNVIFKHVLKSVKHNGRYAADIIEMALLWRYDSVLQRIEHWLAECNVSSSIVSCLDKDIKAMVELKKNPPNGILEQIDCVELQNYTKLIRDYFDSHNGGMLSTLKSIFKRKQ